MIIKDKNSTFPINDLILSLLLSIPFAACTNIGIDAVDFSKDFDAIPAMVFFVLFLMLLFLCFISCGVYAIFKFIKNLKIAERIHSIDINADDIKIIYPNKVINIAKGEIEKIDINFNMMSAITIYNKWVMLLRKTSGILEYIEICIHTTKKQSYKIKKDFFIFFPSMKTIKLFIGLKEILKNYIGLYNLKENEVTVGLAWGQANEKDADEQFLSDMIDSLKKSNKIIRYITIILVISTLLEILLANWLFRNLWPSFFAR